LNNAVPGDYRIEWAAIAGYLTPFNEKKTLEPGAGITFTANYIPTTGTLKVNTNLDAASFTISEQSGLQIYHGGGKSFIQPSALPGTYTIKYDAVAKYITPANQTLTLSAGQTLIFPEGDYTPIILTVSPSSL